MSVSGYRRAAAPNWVAGKGYNRRVICGSKQKLWAMPSRDLYPEIGFRRTLGKVILEIALSGREMMLADSSEQVFEAHFHKDRRVAFITAAANQRIFLSDFSCKGVRLAFLPTPDLCEVATAVESWLIDELTLREMKQTISNLDVSDIAFEIEAGRGITALWNHLLGSLDDYSQANQAYWFEPEFCALVRAAANRPLLRQLVPKVSLGCTLLFSRTLGYPSLIAGNCGIFAARGRCIVQQKDGKIIAEGTIEDMLDAFERTLPHDIGPAIFGTAEDLID